MDSTLDFEKRISVWKTSDLVVWLYCKQQVTRLSSRSCLKKHHLFELDQIMFKVGTIPCGQGILKG